MDNNWDKYIIEGTNVLKNKLGITDKETLEQKEKELVLPHLAFLHLNPILTVPSAEGLKDIHQFLFSDLYSWAGQYRTCTLRKNTYNFTKQDNSVKEPTQIEKILTVLDFNKTEASKIKKIIESFDKDKWYDGGLFGTKLRNLIKDFSYKGKKVNSQNKLFEEFKKNGIIDTKKEGKVDSFKILK